MRALRLIRYAGRLLAGRLTGRPAPVVAFLSLTDQCNLRCTYCSSPYRKTAELTTAQWLAVVEELAGLGCRRITLMGGEPLLRADLREIIEGVRAQGISCVLTTNGLLVKRRLDDLRLLDTLVVSLDGVGAANDEVRGEGVFEAVRGALGAAKEAGIPVKLNAVLSRATAPRLGELLEFVEEHELAMTVNIMRSGAADLWHEAASIRAEDDDIRRALSEMADLARRSPRVLFSEATYRYGALWRDYSADRLEESALAQDDPLRVAGPRCQAGRYHLMIAPDGVAYPCVATVGRIPGGNVAAGGVEAAWKKLWSHPCAACHSPCLVELNYLFSLKPRVLLNLALKHLSRYH